ncbi:MAG: hypothetical protein ACO1QB_11025 [Verrucomicrobiales bacterium]
MKLFKKLYLSAAVLSLGAFASHADGFLFDFGAESTPTIGGVGGPTIIWNNVTTVGMDDFGLVDGLVTTDGTATVLSLQMVARFNGSNENGTTSSTTYPASATRDSLYGNTATFNGLENIYPAFKIVNLDSTAKYSFTFYASRTGVSDNRETQYHLTGAAETNVFLNAANNQTNTVTAANIAPDEANEITVALTPGPNNNNGNQFTYLGILEIRASSGEHYILDFGAGNSITETVESPASAFWNNVTEAIGTLDTGLLGDIVTTNGTPTSVMLQMVSRFNTLNGNGVTTSTNFPATATQDSLFGNTAAFNGLSNIEPEFKLVGLDPNFNYSFTFYGSRNGVSDNRETRFTATGAVSGEALLNASNNTNNVVTIADIRPNEAGEISIAMTPGPANNNANRFTYLGVMKVDFAPIRTPRILIDFGGVNTTDQNDDSLNSWNNLTTAIGATDAGALTNLVRTDNSSTSIGIQMVSRFNGVNESGSQMGTANGAPYVVEATRDSLFGNTESFNGLENITPIFKLIGLNPSSKYTLTFYASRTGVGDNRDTRFTATGAVESFVDYSVANNETETAVIQDVAPDASGEITIALTPGPNNDNGNHFTYLGVLQVDWQASISGTAPTITAVAFENNTFRFNATGTVGATYTLQRTTDFSTWENIQTVTFASPTQEVSAPGSGSAAFYRLLAQ